METKTEETTKTKKRVINAKQAKLSQAFSNNLKISEMNLKEKFSDFENWECTKSKRLLYEIDLDKKHTYKRYPRGSIIKVDFGVNVGGEFSGQHFAITLTKGDGIYNNSIIVIPLTSKKHKGTIDLGRLISEAYIKTLQDEVDKLQDNIQEIDIEKCEFNPDYKKRINEIDKLLKYYKSIMFNFSYARVDHIRTISKLNILPKMNKYDIVGNIKCPRHLLEEIDNGIVKYYTGIDYREFEKFVEKSKKK